MNKPTKERSVVMQAQSVQAILKGQKTQFREVIKPVLSGLVTRVGFSPFTGMWVGFDDSQQESICKFNCPYAVGMRVWVRETFFATEYPNKPLLPGAIQTPNGWAHVAYRSDSEKWMRESSAWMPSIHMPRWASCLTLEICEVRVQRVQTITTEDTRAEGIEQWVAQLTPEQRKAYQRDFVKRFNRYEYSLECKDWFRYLWDSINAERGFGFDSNVWVWALTFRRVEKEAMNL